MYPDFHYLFKSLFGIDIPVLSLLKTFGFFVALAFIAAYRVTFIELRRKAKQGLFTATEEEVEVGHPPKPSDYISSALIGFVVGYKVVGLLMNFQNVASDPLAYVLSFKGNIIGGIALAVVMGWLTYREKKKEQLPKPVKKKYKLFPHDRMMTIVMIAAVAGFVGAKVFNALETWDSFVADPLGSLFSSGGFTFYGGLICAALALYLFARKYNFSFKHLCDATAPALMIAYAIGRLGCHFSGDGDWGIYNSAYITNPDGTLTEQVDTASFNQLVRDQPEIFDEIRNFGYAPHSFFSAPDALPRWTVAMNYTHNVNKEGVPIVGDQSEYNTALPVAVFPTSVYEFFMCSILFVILMALRHRLTIPLKMFGVYLIFNGLERFFIEKIRVNHKYDWFFNLTQAEIISFILVIAGFILLIRKRK